MKAAVLGQSGAQLQIEDRPRPQPRAGEVLIRVHACGVCHGDLMVLRGEFPFARYPIVPGHEVTGQVESVGDRVERIKPGTWVGLSALYSSCGRCQQCLRGEEFLCPQMQFTGVTKDGGYQEFMLADAAFVTPLPSSLDPVEAAPLMCAGLTVFVGLRHAAFQPGHRVAVIGLGGLGQMGVLYARAMGGRVAVLSTSADKEAEARELGAERFINTRQHSPSAELMAWEGGANIILATAPSVDSMTAAISGLAPEGTMSVLGAGPGEIRVLPLELIMGRRRIMGSPAGSRADLRAALEFAAAHGIRARVKRFSLDAAGEALAEMENGRLRGRAVLVMD